MIGRALFGDARFAWGAEVSRAFGRGHGVVVGRTWRRYLVDDGPGHVLAAAPTRTGKGWGIVTPTILNWHGSMVVLDMKRENWLRCSGWLAAQGVDCYRVDLEPADHCSHGWNPLAGIPDGPDRISAIQSVAQLLVPDASTAADPMWAQNARALLMTAALYLVESESDAPTLGAVLRLLTHARGVREHFEAEAKRLARRLSEPCVRNMASFAKINDKTFESIRAHAIGALRLFESPVIDAVTSRSSFAPGDLRRRRMAVFLTVSVDRINKLRPLVAIFLQQVLEANLGTLPEHDASLAVPLLMVLDEFTQLGAMPVITERVGLTAGFGVRYLTVIQSMAAMERIYGQAAAREFADNCATRIFFRPANTDDAEAVSKLLGAQTVRAASRSRKPFGSVRSLSESDTRRPLMLPQELMTLSGSRCIIRTDSCERPVLARKIAGWKDRLLLDSILPPAPVPALVLRSAQVAPPPVSAEHVAAAAAAILEE